LNPEDGTDRLFRNMKQITTTRCVLTQKSAVLVRVTVKSQLLVVLGNLICFLDLWGERNGLFTFWTLCRCFSFLILFPLHVSIIKIWDTT